jgi:hypothetical protein
VGVGTGLKALTPNGEGSVCIAPDHMNKRVAHTRAQRHDRKSPKASQSVPQKLSLSHIAFVTYLLQRPWVSNVLPYTSMSRATLYLYRYLFYPYSSHELFCSDGELLKGSELGFAVDTRTEARTDLTSLDTHLSYRSLLSRTFLNYGTSCHHKHSLLCHTRRALRYLAHAFFTFPIQQLIQF